MADKWSSRQPDYAAALDRFADASKDAVMIAESPLLVRDRAILVPLPLDRRIPAIGASPEDAQAGALISYGVDVVADVLRRGADYVDRIAKGAEPADLPIGAAYQIQAGDQSENGVQRRVCSQPKASSVPADYYYSK